MKTTFVDLETARSAKGVRLVTLANAASPWSEAAKGIFRLMEIPFVAVRLGPRDDAIRAWTGVSNAPVVLFDDEPPRSGWSEILALAERLAPARSLVPSNPHDRVKLFGLAHEILGENGLIWCFRARTIAVGLTTDGARGFAPPVAKYLAKRYVDTPERAAHACERIETVCALLVETLAGRDYFFGDAPTALDVYSAAAMNTLAPLSPEKCPMAPQLLAAFASMSAEIPSVAAALVVHRDRTYERHLELPISL